MRSLWSGLQFHVGLSWSLIGFFEIAFSATRYEVFPRLRSTNPSWNDMVDREIFSSSAVLTLVVIAGKY